MPIVSVPGHGDVEFPDSMGEQDILAAIQKLPKPSAADQRKAAAAAMPVPGLGLSFGRGAAQGATLGFGDEIEGTVQALGRKYLPDSLGGGSEADRRRPLGELRRQSRDVARAENDAAKLAHPVAFGAGEIVGGIAPATLAGAAFAPAGPAWAIPRAQKVGAALKTAAGLAGAMGAGTSTAEGIGGQALDAAKSAAIGVASLPVASLATAGLGAVARGARDVAMNQTRRVMLGGKNTLSRTLKAPSDGAVAEVLDTGIVPFGSTKTTSARVDAAREEVGQLYSQIVAQLEARGVRGPKAHKLAQDLATEATAIEANTLGSPRPGMFRDTARELYRKPVDTQGRLGLKQAEGMKQELQWDARAEFDKLNHLQTPKGQAKEDIASRVRQAVEDAIEQQRHLAPDVADRFVPTKQRYGNLAEAGNTLREGVNAANRRSGPSLPDTIAGAAMAAKHGVPVGVLAKFGHKVWRERGPSAMAWGADATSDLLNWILSQGDQAGFTRAGLAQALRTPTARAITDKAAAAE